MRIRFKLISGFGIIAFLVILVGVSTFIQTTQIEDEFHVVVEETTPAIVALGNIKSNIFLVTLEANEYILDPAEEHLEELQEGKEKLGEAILAYEKVEGEVEQFKLGIIKINSLVDEIIYLKDSGASMDILLEKSKMLDDTVEEFSHELEEDIERDTLRLNKSHQVVNDLIQVTNNLTIFIIGIIIILSIIITLTFSTSILKPITNLSNTANEIALGNLKVRIKVEGNDEISKLSSDVNIMADSLLQQKKKLIKSEKINALGHITSSLAHNLKNPLTVIKATTDIIDATSNSVDKKTKERLNLIKTSTENMLNQIEDILDFLKHKPLELKEASLSEILNTAIKNIEKPERIKINLPKKDIMIECDAAKLQVVFMNMMTNSIEAVEGNGEITIFGFRNGRETTIEITDTGKEIVYDELEKMFDALYTTKPTGTGLGLSYCKSVIEQHGGSIEVSRNPTRFTIILPTQIPLQYCK